MSGTLTEVVMLRGIGKGLSMVMVCETLCLTGVVRSIVLMIPDGTDLK